MKRKYCMTIKEKMLLVLVVGSVMSGLRFPKLTANDFGLYAVRLLTIKLNLKH
jgi:hypothetical protein